MTRRSPHEQFLHNVRSAIQAYAHYMPSERIDALPRRAFTKRGVRLEVSVPSSSPHHGPRRMTVPLIVTSRGRLYRETHNGVKRVLIATASFEFLKCVKRACETRINAS